MESRGFSEFGAFYGANCDRCVSAVTMVVRDRLLAEDLVAEAFARLFSRWSDLRRHPDPKAWVVRTALNVNISRWRRRRHEVGSLDGLDAPGRGLDGRLATWQPASMDERIVAAVANLPLRQRQVIALRIFLDLDTADTAATLGVAEGTVSAHLHRATTALRAVLSPAHETRCLR